MDPWRPPRRAAPRLRPAHHAKLVRRRRAQQKQNLYNATILSSHLYSLDNQGRRSGQTEVIAGTTKTWSYLYDNLDRLTSASDGTAETYSYDIFGNRRSKSKAGTTTAYLYDLAHQLTEIRSGSDTGTLTGAAVHDADGHMVKLCENGTVTKTATDCTATATLSGANAVTGSYVVPSASPQHLIASRRADFLPV